jgi:hypothetical protein
MTQRVKGFVITLVDDYRDEDADAVLMAMRMVKGVQPVEPITANPDDQVIYSRFSQEVVRDLRG